MKKTEFTSSEESKIKTRMQSTMTFVITLVMFYVVYLLAHNHIPEENKDIFYTATGVILSTFRDAFNYYFSSNFSSARKDELLLNKKPE